MAVTQVRLAAVFLALAAMMLTPVAHSAQIGTTAGGFPWAIHVNGTGRPDLAQNLFAMTLTEENVELRIDIRFSNWGIVPGQAQPSLLFSDGPGRIEVGQTISLSLDNASSNCAIQQIDMLFPADRPPEILAICTGALTPATTASWTLPAAGFMASFSAPKGRMFIKGAGDLNPGLPFLRVGHIATLSDIGAASGNYRISRVEQTFDRNSGLRTTYSGVVTTR